MDLKSKVDQNIWISPQVNNETREYIEFSSSTTFNGIRTNYSQTPYLLQVPEEDHKRCDIKKIQKQQELQDLDFTQIISNPGSGYANQTICQHVLKFPFAETENTQFLSQSGKRSWQEIVLINDDSGVSHPIHQHGGWYWVVGEGQFNFKINSVYSSLSNALDKSKISNLKKYKNGIKKDLYN